MTDFNPSDWHTDDQLPGNYVHQGTGEVVTSGQYHQWMAAWTGHPGGQLATVDDNAIAALFDQPALDIVGWARALAQNAAYDDDGDASPELDMVIAILSASSSAEAMAVTNVRTAEDLIGTEPGGHSPLLQITGARPLKSTFKEGPPCFCIVDATIKATGEAIKLSTGGRTVQAVILAHVNRGWLPFEAILTRRLKPTRAGFYPLNLEAGG
jgi:hypothetical protein